MASLRMLKAVMAEVHPNKDPYQVFDMIGGTSTGGYAHCLLYVSIWTDSSTA